MFYLLIFIFYFSIYPCCSCSLSIENDLLTSRGLNTSNSPLSDHEAAMLQISLKLLWTTPRLRWRSSQTRCDACSTKSADSTVFHVNTWSPWPSNCDSKIEDEKENKKDNLSQKIFMQNSIMLEELFKRFVLLLEVLCFKQYNCNFGKVEIGKYF